MSVQPWAPPRPCSAFRETCTWGRAVVRAPRTPLRQPRRRPGLPLWQALSAFRLSRRSTTSVLSPSQDRNRINRRAVLTWLSLTVSDCTDGTACRSTAFPAVRTWRRGHSGSAFPGCLLWRGGPRGSPLTAPRLCCAAHARLPLATATPPWRGFVRISGAAIPAVVDAIAVSVCKERHRFVAISSDKALQL